MYLSQSLNNTGNFWNNESTQLNKNNKYTVIFRQINVEISHIVNSNAELGTCRVKLGVCKGKKNDT